VGYSDAKFVEGFGTVPAGSTIPSAPEWTASASLEHSFRYSNAVTLRTRLDSQYVGSQLTAPFRSVDLGRPVDSFTIANLSIAFERSGWAASVFVKNLTNKYAIVDRTPLSGLPEQYTLYRPRTVGVQLLANL
jgi:outer membrane receptor protein involved in Fe transport